MAETGCINDEEKIQSVTDTDDKFTECQTPRKKFQSVGISPVSLYAVPQDSPINNAKMKLDEVMNTLKSDISEAYKVQVDCLEDSGSDSYDKNDMKEKANELVRLHGAIQEKLKTASYSEQIQILTLVPDKWSRKTVQNIFIPLNTLYERHMKSKM